MKNLVFLLPVFVLCSCVTEYNEKYLPADTSKHFLIAHLYADEGIKVSYGPLLIPGKKNPLDTLGAFMQVLRNNTVFDTLRYLKRNPQKNFLPEYQYRSSQNKTFTDNNTYSLKVKDKIYEFGKLPSKPMIDSVVYSPYVYVQAETDNYFGEGSIYLHQNENSRYLGILFEYEEVDKSPLNTYYTIRTPIDFPKEYFCKGNKGYIVDEGFSSFDKACISNNRILFSYSNLPENKKMRNPKIKVCSIRDDLAEFYASKENYYEGTDFFFAPTQKTKIKINDDKVVGILSCVSCVSISVKLK